MGLQSFTTTPVVAKQIYQGMGKMTLTMKEIKRVEVIQKAVSGEITVLEAKEFLGLSERHVYRLKGSFKLKGVKGVIHGNRGKVSFRRLDTQVSAKIIELANGEYEGYNDSFFTEKLREEEGIWISWEKVRQILRKPR